MFSGSGKHSSACDALKQAQALQEEGSPRYLDCHSGHFAAFCLIQQLRSWQACCVLPRLVRQMCRTVIGLDRHLLALLSPAAPAKLTRPFKWTQSLPFDRHDRVNLVLVQRHRYCGQHMERAVWTFSRQALARQGLICRPPCWLEVRQVLQVGALQRPGTLQRSSCPRLLPFVCWRGP